MKKFLLASLLFVVAFPMMSQNGLENIVVETYYVSDANDATVNSAGGVLPVGSVTRRIFVDMLPGYKFQAAYGIPGHELRIETSTLFFNNEDRGAISPTFTKNQAKGNTVMLDTWVSVGGACAGNLGVLKTADDGVATNVNNDGVLQNAHPAAGIPLTQQDGLILGTVIPATILGADSQFAMFDASNDGSNGPIFSTFDGSWASLGGSAGPDPSTNQVLIAQITTDGILSFELNIQLGTPSGGVENYVAFNPGADEILAPSLTYTSEVITKLHFQNVNDQLFELYPNPAQETLSFRMNQPTNNGIGRCSIFSMRGDLVSVQTFNQFGGETPEKLDISSLSKGQYIVELIVNGKRSTQKFIKH